MKKLILMVVLIGAFGFVSIEANTNENVISKLCTFSDEITFQELPAAVQDAFTETYSKESVVKVIKHDEKTFEIHVELEDGEKALKYNSNGELLKEWSVE